MLIIQSIQSEVQTNGKDLFDDENKALNSMVGNPNNLSVQNLLELFPNPATAQLNISYKTKDLQNSELSLYDMTGRFIMAVQLPANANKVSVNVQYLASGVYNYKQTIEGQILSTGKFVKE